MATLASELVEQQAERKATMGAYPKALNKPNHYALQGLDGQECDAKKC